MIDRSVQVVEHRKQRLDDALASTQERIGVARFEPLARVLEIGLRAHRLVAPLLGLSERLVERGLELVAPEGQLSSKVLGKFGVELVFSPAGCVLVTRHGYSSSSTTS